MRKVGNFVQRNAFIKFGKFLLKATFRQIIVQFTIWTIRQKPKYYREQCRAAFPGGIQFQCALKDEK